MAYRSGYPLGYQDDSGTYLFTPTTEGYSIPIGHQHKHHSMWPHYGTPIKVQTNILYTAGASALVQSPHPDVTDAADPGSGKGDKMWWPTPGPDYPISDADAQVIIDDGTYADEVSQ